MSSFFNLIFIAVTIIYTVYRWDDNIQEWCPPNEHPNEAQQSLIYRCIIAGKSWSFWLLDMCNFQIFQFPNLQISEISEFLKFLFSKITNFRIFQISKFLKKAKNEWNEKKKKKKFVSEHVYWLHKGEGKIWMWCELWHALAFIMPLNHDTMMLWTWFPWDVSPSLYLSFLVSLSPFLLPTHPSAFLPSTNLPPPMQSLILLIFKCFPC